jgi:hypothetical protein
MPTCPSTRQTARVYDQTDMANKPVKVTVFRADPDLRMPPTPFQVAVHGMQPSYVDSEPGDVAKEPPFFVGVIAWNEALAIEPDTLDIAAGSRLTIMMDADDVGDLAQLNRLVEHPRLRDVDIDVYIEKARGD